MSNISKVPLHIIRKSSLQIDKKTIFTSGSIVRCIKNILDLIVQFMYNLIFQYIFILPKYSLFPIILNLYQLYEIRNFVAIISAMRSNFTWMN